MITASIRQAFGIGGPELAILLIVGLFVAGLVLVILAVVRASKKGSAPPHAGTQNSTQSRLQELDALRSNGQISQSEYEDKRQKIIDDL